MPSAKMAGYEFTRLGGTDCWHTVRLIDTVAAGQAAPDSGLVTTTTGVER